MNRVFGVLCFIVGAILFAGGASGNQVLVGEFSKSDLDGWAEKVFSGKTSYIIATLRNKMVLKAESSSSASCLIKKTSVDIREYPYLNWSWRIENRFVSTNKDLKSSDDYAARIFVVIDGGLLLWKAKAVNYVWAASQAGENEIWPSPFAGNNSMMVALRTSTDKLSTWYDEKRNVYEDVKNLYGS
ncbi:MAG: DUF3047 domain-containing protein, partial [Desulfobacterales bacterium]|nr:DUF3047 domain-containing protein [Desulfobacterales bacterium]